MNAMRTSSIVSQRDIHTAARHYGHAAAPWLAAKEQHQSAMAAVECALLLKEAGISISSVSLLGRLRRAIGIVFVRIGLRLQGASGQPAVATPR
jgi:hypothetical protein